MIPFYALVVSFILFKMLGLLGVSHFAGWQTSLQAASAIMLLLGASAHWGSKRADLIRMVPRGLPLPGAIVTVTGLLEIAGAIGLLFPATSRATSIALALLLAAMFPANVLAARERLNIGGRPVTKLLPRTLLQIFLIAAVLLAG